jgi:hypothetical protein
MKNSIRKITTALLTFIVLTFIIPINAFAQSYEVVKSSSVSDPLSNYNAGFFTSTAIVILIGVLLYLIDRKNNVKTTGKTID